jgi:hypothetical protein
VEEAAMTADWQRELEAAVDSGMPLDEVVALLRQYKERGITRDQVYGVLESLRASAPDEATDDRIREVSDFVAGFCSPHMRIWDG